jgi:hypothetical protein
MSNLKTNLSLITIQESELIPIKKKQKRTLVNIFKVKFKNRYPATHLYPGVRVNSYKKKEKRTLINILN